MLAQKEALAAEKAAAAGKEKNLPQEAIKGKLSVEKAYQCFFMSTIGREVGRTLIRGILGSLKR